MPVARSLVSDQVFRLLCEDLLSGRYAPGDLLPTQRRLAADLGVNMAGVREAVKRLEQLRLVESRQGEGMRVLDWRESGGLDVLTHLAGALDGSTLAEVMEARRLMLVEAARLAAERRDEPQARRLEEVAERIAAGDGDPQALDFAFFSELVDAARNVVFVLITNSIRELYFERAPAFAPMLGPELGPLYLRAARAVVARDARRAAAAVRRLAERQEERLLEARA